MEATPFEHVVVEALATNWTGEVTVAPLDGVVTLTVANAGATNARSARGMQGKGFMMPPFECVFLRCESRSGSGLSGLLNRIVLSGNCAGLKDFRIGCNS